MISSISVGAEARDRRVAAHPAGVWPLVAVEDPLVVLGAGQRNDVLAVAEGEQGELLPSRNSSRTTVVSPKRRSVKKTSTAASRLGR